MLKPNYYIKADDYKVTDLTSRKVLEEWSGEVILIPLVKEKSTTNVIDAIVKTYCNQPISINLEKNSAARQKAVIFDRDGIINEEIEYLHEVEKLSFIPHALDGILKMQKMGFKIVVATTQAGIGLGYFTKEDFFRVNKAILKEFNKHGIVVSKVYYCPHSIEEKCSCRKPEIGLIKKAQKDLNLNLRKCWVIGDKTSDVLAGKKSGCHTILVSSGHAGADKEFTVKPDYIASDLINAARFIQKNS